MRHRPLVAAAVAALVLMPWIPGVPLSVVVNANLAGEFAIIAISLVILTGWVGQISLGQGAFVGIGAFTTGLLARELGVPFPLNVPLVAAITAAVAALLGLVALRVRGLYLAVATLIFAWMADAYLFAAQWFSGSAGASTIDNRPIGVRDTVTRFDLSNKRVFWWVVLAVVAAVWYVAHNIKDSKTGRAFFAVRGSEMAAVSLGIDVTRVKLLAFALSGALAGIAGNLIMTDLRTVTPVGFQFTVSLFYLGIAVVGGITSLGGAVAAAVLFAGLNEAFLRLKFLTGWLDVVTVGLLLVVLLGYPGGLGALGSSIRRAASRAAERRAARRAKRQAPRRRPLAPRVRALVNAVLRALPRRPQTAIVRRRLDLSAIDTATSEAPVEELAAVGAAALGRAPRDWRAADTSSFALPPARRDRTVLLEAEGIVVRFGGLTAANDVSLVVREHEIVGLIGPNGAGKTTTFNAIAGLNRPTAGRVRLYGQDVTELPVHVRAQMGVGRTFQLIQLFPQLTVFENLLVATNVHDPTGFFAHALITDRAITEERKARQQVRAVIGMLGLEEFADRAIGGLPFGVLRQVEIARALVTRAPLLMLDEPASGLDNAETDELARLLRFLRAELGVSILLIEHDVRMVTAVCDYIYVINRGSPLADGRPEEIQRHPEVLAAYLGEPEAAHA